MKIKLVLDFATAPVSLRHEAGLQPHLRLAHVAFDFGLRYQGCHGIDDDDVDTVRANEHFDDFEGLLAIVRLRHEEVVDVDAESLRIGRVERMLGIHKSRHSAKLLSFSNHLQRQRRLARRLGAEDLHDAPARDAAHTECEVDADSARRNGVDWLDGALLAEAHDRPFAKLLLDLGKRKVDGFGLLAILVTVD